MSMRYQAGIVTASYFPLKVPNAPTIGTATFASSTSVSVTFTAPSNVGGGAITSYVATAKKTSDGTLWGWGWNDQGALGLGNATNYSSPKQIGSLTSWLAVASGQMNALAIKSP